MNEFIIIYCYRKIWEEIRNLINTPRMTTSLRVEMLLKKRQRPRARKLLLRNHQRKKSPRKRRRTNGKILSLPQLRKNAAAASASALPRTLMEQHAADVSQSSVVPFLSLSSHLPLSHVSSPGITSYSSTSIFTGGTLWSASCCSFQSLLPPTSLSPGWSRIPERQEFSYGHLSCCLWFP